MGNKIIAVIMAAGEGPRMKSSLPKVMHKICGHPMIEYVVTAALEVSNYDPVVIVGRGSDMIEGHLENNVRYVHQREGSNEHALMATRVFLGDETGYALILAGDVPLITSNTLQGFVDYCQKGSYDALSLSSSIHCFNISSLLKGLDKLNNSNSKERDLTHLLGVLKKEGMRVGVYTQYDPTEVMSINTRLEQAQAGKIMGQRINNNLLEQGVTMLDPDNTYIDPYVTIGKDTIIYPGNVLEGRTTIGEGSILYPNNRILNSIIGKDTQIQSSVILESEIGDRTTVGPFAYIRPGSLIGKNVRIGDFVEIKNSRIHEGSKVSHLTYVGDGEIGKNVNIGCGVVFVNYDGKNKHRTIVEDNAFIGCNSNLVAPVRVKSNSYVAAGSTITDDVPDRALAIARARQINKENWVAKHKNETEENQ